jgi:hypothetical protein
MQLDEEPFGATSGSPVLFAETEEGRALGEDPAPVGDMSRLLVPASNPAETATETATERNCRAEKGRCKANGEEEGHSAARPRS